MEDNHFMKATEHQASPTILPNDTDELGYEFDFDEFAAPRKIHTVHNAPMQTLLETAPAHLDDERKDGHQLITIATLLSMPPPPSSPELQSTEAPKTPPRTSRNDKRWEELQDEIHYRYLIENKSLDKTMDEISEAFSFKMSKRSWKMKLKEWGYEKHLTEEAMLTILAKAEKRRLEEGKDTEFLHNGLMIPESKIENFRKRKRLNEESSLSAYASAATPLKVALVTPMTSYDLTGCRRSDVVELDSLVEEIELPFTYGWTSPRAFDPYCEIDAVHDESNESQKGAAIEFEKMGEVLISDAQKAFDGSLEAYTSALTIYRALHDHDSVTRCRLATIQLRLTHSSEFRETKNDLHEVLVEIVTKFVNQLMSSTSSMRSPESYKLRDTMREISNRYEEFFQQCDPLGRMHEPWENGVLSSLRNTVELLSLPLDDNRSCHESGPNHARFVLRVYKELGQLARNLFDIKERKVARSIEAILDTI